MGVQLFIYGPNSKLKKEVVKMVKEFLVHGEELVSTIEIPDHTSVESFNVYIARNKKSRDIAKGHYQKKYYSKQAVDTLIAGEIIMTYVSWCKAQGVMVEY